MSDEITGTSDELRILDKNLEPTKERMIKSLMTKNRMSRFDAVEKVREATLLVDNHLYLERIMIGIYKVATDLERLEQSSKRLERFSKVLVIFTIPLVVLSIIEILRFIVEFCF